MNKEMFDFIFQLLAVFKPYYALFAGVIALLIVAVIVIYAVKIAKYKSSTYYADTGKGFFEVEGDKGALGEYMTYDNLKSYEKYGAKFLFNVYLPKEDKTTTELDVIMISPKGVFVFESKNYSGWIFGSDKDAYWTQTLPTGKKSTKKKFYNPVWQNKSHIENLKKAVGEDIPICSVIVFSDRCELKKVDVALENAVVINRREVENTVMVLMDKYEKIADVDTVEVIYNKLKPFTEMTNEQKEKHIKDIEEKNSSDICPRCKSKLAIRTVKNGANAGKRFYGCSNYPKCRYTRDI